MDGAIQLRRRVPFWPVRRTLCRAIAFSAGLLCAFLLFFPTASPTAQFPKATKPLVLKQLVPPKPDPPQHIPINAIEKWRTQQFLVVFGIPSEDSEARRRRRNLQRKTCWQYDGVATKENNYNGTMLVLYILGRSPLHQHKYSPEMVEEAKKWEDVILLDLNEANKTNKSKTIGVAGDWGYEASLGISFKTFRWLDLALRMFPKARYVAKGDDDMFLRVPQYLADFNVLPPRGVHWGNIIRYRHRVFKEQVPYSFSHGPCMTLERSAAKAVVFYKPLRRLAMKPYRRSLKEIYRYYAMHGDDRMVGLALSLSLYKHLVVVKDNCRLVLYSQHLNFEKANASWVMLHHIKESDYEKIMSIFAKTPVFVFELKKDVENNGYYFSCSISNTDKKQ